MFHHMPSPRSLHTFAPTMTKTPTASASHGGDPPSPPQSRSPQRTQPADSEHTGREQTVSYADLMKPDEDWRTLPNAADRRKIQNRLAQRAYRRSLRERNEEIKRLKKQVEKLEETQAQGGELATPATEPDANPGPGAGPGPALATSVPATYHDADTVHSAASVISASDWMGDYLGVWPHTPLSEHGSFPGQVDFPGMDMDTAADHLLQSVVPEPGLDRDANGMAETIHPAAASHYPLYHGKGGCNSGSSNSSTAGSTTGSTAGSHDMFSYQPMSLGPDGMGAASPFMCSNAQRHTPRSAPCGGNSSRPRTTSMMESGACSPYHEAPHRSSCCCNTGSTTPDYSGRGSPHPSAGGKEHERQRSLIRPLDNMESLYIQGLVVEPSDGGDGVTIRLPPSATDGRATNLVAFMIQRDANGLGNSNNQAYRTDHDGHH